MENQIITIIIAVISSGLIQFIFNRVDDKFSILNKINSKLDYLEVGLTRTQLLVLMSDYKERQEEIMKLAYKYFHDLKGDFYMTTLFKNFLEENNIDTPEWFKSGNI